MAVEMVILVPILFMFILLIVAFGRYVSVKGDIEAAARDAARAASMESSVGEAEAMARRVVDASVDGTSNCRSTNLTGNWAPGGEIQVRLQCTVSYSGLGLIGLPGSTNIEATSAVPLDPFRRYQ